MTIGNLPVEMDLMIRFKLTAADLGKTALVCTSWENLNNQRILWKELLEKNFPSYIPSEKYLLKTQYCFLKRVSKLGTFPFKLLKSIGKFYQFKKMPYFGNLRVWRDRSLISLKIEEIKDPVMFGFDYELPFVVFKLKVRVPESIEDFGKEGILFLTPQERQADYKTWEYWGFEYRSSAVTKLLGLPDSWVFTKYEDYSERIEKVLKKSSIEKVILIA